MTILSSTLLDKQVVELAHAVSRLLGWTYFLCWAVSAYPQLIINYSRKSVTGLALDYFTVNILGFSCYTISSILFLFSPVVRDEYARRHPRSPEPTVRWNDLAFAVCRISIPFLSKKNSNNVVLTVTINPGSCALEQSRNLVTILFLGI